MNLTSEAWEKVETHYGRKCELNEQGEVLFWNGNFPVGYIATEYPYTGYLVDTMEDRDTLICKLC